MTFNDVKTKVLSALTQFPNETDVPSVSKTEDFEICVGRKTKRVCVPMDSGLAHLTRLQDTGGDGVGHKLEFEIIDGEKRMKDVFSKPWEVAYVKFRNSDGAHHCFRKRLVLTALGFPRDITPRPSEVCDPCGGRRRRRSSVMNAFGITSPSEPPSGVRGFGSTLGATGSQTTICVFTHSL